MTSSGLENVVAAETVLSHVDGAAGYLIMRGHSLDELIETHRFEDVIALLFDGFFDTLPASDELALRLGAARQSVFPLLQNAGKLCASLSVFDGMRALTAMVEDGKSLDDALALLAATSVFGAGLMRLKSGQELIAPDPSLPHATDILRMLHGAMPDDAEATALDRYLVTVADHSLNASTFTARVVASTEAGLMSSVVAALGALKGPLHGGAPGPVLDMIDAIGTDDNIDDWLNASLDSGARLMGFGHRIYRVRDPRADALMGALDLMESDAGGRLEFARKVERAALEHLRAHKPDRVLQTNVEFYTALLLERLGFPRDAFTSVFAMGRTVGWIAHAQEQAQTGRLIRPSANYIGPVTKDAA